MNTQTLRRFFANLEDKQFKFVSENSVCKHNLLPIAFEQSAENGERLFFWEAAPFAQ